MRKRAKAFDCVQMKRDIQAALAAEDAGLSPEERIAAREKRIMAGPFAAIWAARKKSPAEREKTA